MALYKASVLEREAAARGEAVVAFDSFNVESIKWATEVGEELNQPVICMYYYGSMHPSMFTCMALNFARRSKGKVALIMDHGKTFETVLHSIKYGLSSVMIDGSSLAYEDNVRVTSEVVRAAHALDVDVEGELGFVGRASNVDDYTNRAYYTDPEMAADFVRRTEVDTLAIAIGTAHGNYPTTPALDFDRLAAIRSRVDIPLALHGGTDVPEEQIRRAIRMGISKVNIGTAYRQAYYNGLKDIIDGEKSDKEMASCTRALEGEVKAFLRGMFAMMKG